MNSAGLEDWIFWFTGAILALAGLALGAWALFWDRPRGHKRCPKCWYPMDGVPAPDLDGRSVWTCPECGKRAPDARSLARTRRRPGFATLGAALLLTSFLSAKIPHWKRAGWVSLVPTSVLVLAAPATQTGSQWARTSMFLSNQGFRPSLMGQGLVTPPATIPDHLECAAWSRLREGKMWRWQSQLFIERCANDTGLTLLPEVAIPARWVRGEPVPVHLGLPGGLRADLGLPGRVRLAGEKPPRATERGLLPGASIPGEPIMLSLELHTEDRVIYSHTYAVPMKLVEKREDILKPLSAEEATRRVRAALDLRIEYDGDRARLTASNRAGTAEWASIYFVLAYKVEVLIDGEIVGCASGSAAWDHFVQREGDGLDRVEWDPGALERVLQQPRRATCVVTGDYEAAWRFFRDWPFNKPNAAAWTGSYQTPLRVDDVVERARQ